MTLENCKILLKQFNDIIDGTVPKPFGHKDWADVIANAKYRAKAMEARIERKLQHHKYSHLRKTEPIVDTTTVGEAVEKSDKKTLTKPKGKK